MKKHLKYLTGKTTLTFGAKFLVVGLGYLFAMYCTNVFDAAVYGLFSLAFMALNLSKVVSVFGFDYSLLRNASSLIATGNIRKAKDVYVKSLSFTFLVSAILSLALFFAAEIVAEHLFNSPELQPYLEVTALCLIPYSLVSLNSELVKASGNSVVYMLLNEGMYFGIAIVSVQLICGLAETCNVMVGFLVAVLVLMLYSFYWIHTRLTVFTVDSETGVSFSDLFRSSFNFLLAGSSVFLKNWSDIFLLGVFLDPKQVGIYSVVFKISKTVTIPVTTINSVQAPIVSKLFDSGRLSELKDYIGKTNMQMVSLALPVSLVVLLFPEFLIQFFGDELVVGAVTLQVLILGFLFKAFAGSATLLLQMTGGEKRFMQTAFASLLIGTLLNILLIPELGILGAGLTSTIVHLIWNGLCVYFSSKIVGFNSMVLSLGKSSNATVDPKL